MPRDANLIACSKIVFCKNLFTSLETQGQIVSAQSEGRTAATVWNWSGKTLSPGALLALLLFSSCHIFKRLAVKSIGAI